MSLFDDFLNEDVSASDIAKNTQAGVYGSPASSSGWQSSILSLGTSYLQGLTQVDLARRYSQVSNTQPRITSNQSPVGQDLTTRAASGLGSMRVGNLLPFILLGLGAWVVLGRG
jgi:hypothetical protein